MPALLTRMSTPSSSASAFWPSALTSSRSARLAGEQLDAFAKLGGQRLKLLDARAMQADDGALRMQCPRDRLADAARCAGDERLAAGQIEHCLATPLRWVPIPVSGERGERRPRPRPACRSPPWSSWRSMRRARPRQHLAGADLIKRGDAVAPRTIRSSRASARGRSPARPAGRRSRRGSVSGATATLATTGTDRRPILATSASAARIASAAGCISAEWNGAETGSMIARLAPFVECQARGGSTAALAPEMTNCPPPLSLAIWQVASRRRPRRRRLRRRPAPGR